MAITKFGRKGFGQVEPNHLSGIVEGKIYAQLPCDSAMGDYIENGRFAKYDMAAGKVTTNANADGQWCLIYNEESHFDEREQSHKDFCMKKEDYIGGIMVPRLIATEVGDIFTTNTFGATQGKNSKLVGPYTTKDFDVNYAALDDLTDAKITEGVYVNIGEDGYLVVGTKTADAPVFKVVKAYTMPDGQPGVKLQRIK